jgi:hypothetical protein
MLTPLLLVAGALLSAAALLAGWAQLQLLDSQRWSDTSQKLLERQEIRRRLAEYVVHEVRAAAGGALPPGVGDQLEQTVETELASARSERVWRVATVQAHRQLVRIIEDGGGRRDAVTLDLRPLIRSVAADIGVPLPAVPAGVGRITIVAGNQVRGAREAAGQLERTATVLAILAAAALLVAVAAARGWRLRALAGAGLAVAAAGTIVLLTRALVGSHVVDVLTQSPPDRDAVKAAWSVSTSLLSTMAWIAIAAGLAVALAAGVAGRPRERFL